MPRGRPKLDELGEADVEALCQMYREGMGMRDLSGLFHISYNEARRILIEQKVPIRRRGRPSI